jgi:hypothetical protein
MGLSGRRSREYLEDAEVTTGALYKKIQGKGGTVLSPCVQDTFSALYGFVEKRSAVPVERLPDDAIDLPVGDGAKDMLAWFSLSLSAL